jgi:hypothetical protein
MAYQGKSNAAVKPGMKDLTDSNVARSGAAKKVQTKFPVKDGMKDMTTMSAGPANPGSGPDASSPNPLSPEPQSKILRRQPQVLKSSWGMKGAGGKAIDTEIGPQVLAEAARLGK